ncbi:hypothetical protein TCE0_033f09734 [Talaromyces pinophilus]|uniref:Uncharacterized protein n=1 Tax=Talaromyces pinophilus TaxID=128442 RepID=A0A6V8HCN2_TALPI|nr:hypothetical protein TCE0_033f09734 [Talaromyces pinophilus]
MDHIDTVPDLLNCACVNNLWNVRALKRLYKGSLNDMRYRTPNVGSLNCLFVASRERFVQNMGFVKHLLLHPEKPLTRGAESGFATLVCGESCRPLRYRRYAEALLRPEGGARSGGGGGGGLVSLTIPFVIVNQDWMPISDLLISPSLEFLAINDYYCVRVILGCTNTSGSSINSELLREKLSHLKALTIYHCGGGSISSHHLYEVVRCCDLQFFHFEDWKRYPLLSPDISKLLTSLKTQRNLKALALRTNLSRRESIPGTIARAEEWGEAWPDLKALYLTQVDQLRLGEIVKFKELEILSLNDSEAYQAHENLYSIAGVATCRNLRVLDIWFRQFDDQEMLLKIARGCPLLRRLSVQCSYQSWFLSDLDSTIFHGLLRTLPNLEYLDLTYNIKMTGAWILELAINCPNLTVLRLRQTRLFISLEQLRKAQSFQKLEIMNINRIFFQDPQSLMMEPHEFSILASEWRRVFPKIHAMPCSDDISGAKMEKTYQDNIRNGISNERSSESDSDHDSGSEADEADEAEEGARNNDPWFDDYRQRSDWFLLRLKLWEELQYVQDKAIYDRIANLWQTDFEIENIGWPVMPLNTFGSDDII